MRSPGDCKFIAARVIREWVTDRTPILPLLFQYPCGGSKGCGDEGTAGGDPITIPQRRPLCAKGHDAWKQLGDRRRCLECARLGKRASYARKRAGAAR